RKTPLLFTLTTFLELAMPTAYNYINVNKEMSQDMTLLIPAYNHFVHFLLLDKYKKDKKKEGKVILLLATSSHSVTTTSWNKSLYTATRILHNKDLALPLQKRKSLLPNFGPRRRPNKILLQKEANAILPIDFYKPSWYHNLTPVQQQTIQNRNALAFLTNAKQ
ncbi:hypothetical protein VP01_9610g1, partial [Puccinia sorghi]